MSHSRPRAAQGRGQPDDGYFPLPSKFAPPQFSVPLVHRRRLIEHLDAGLERAVITVFTAAGYGKTTLLSQWQRHLGERGTRAIWIGLDEGEQSAPHLVLCIAAALARAGLISKALPQALAQGLSGVRVRDTLRSLIAELGALDQRLVLILDDYHLAETLETATILDVLCRDKPDALTVVVAARSRPQLALSRLRSAGRLLELTQADLCFDDEEVAVLLEGSRASGDVALLAERTERWAVALQLARIWASDAGDSRESIREFKGSNAELAAYLSEQVLHGLAPPVRDFLVDTSILERVNGDLGDALRGGQESWHILDELERLNALVFALDAQRHWYRYHQLFRDFLRHQLGRRGEEHIRELHRRASAWHAGKGLIAEAVGHATKAGEEALALDIADAAECHRRILWEGEGAYKRFLTAFDPQSVRSRPRIRTALALVRLKEGRFVEGQRGVEELKGDLAAGRIRLLPADEESVLREIALIDGLIGHYRDVPVTADIIAQLETVTGRVDPGDRWYRGLLESTLCLWHFRADNVVNAMASAHASLECFEAVGNPYAAFFASLQLGMFQLARGHLADASTHLLRCRAIVVQHFPYNRSLDVLSRIPLAEVAYETDRPEEAENLLRDVVAELDLLEGWHEIYRSLYRTASALAFHREGVQAAQAIIERGRAIARKRLLARLECFLDCREATLLGWSGGLEQAAALTRRARIWLDSRAQEAASGDAWEEREELGMCTARLALAEGRTARALEILDPLARHCESHEHFRRLPGVLALITAARHAAADGDGASAALKRMLTLSRPDRIVRSIVDERPLVDRQLRAAIAHMGMAGLATESLDWIAEVMLALRAPAERADNAILVSMFTPREREVLRHLCVGMSNKVIARRLGMSDNAVKFHLKNIFRKLGVNTRKLAVSVAQKNRLAGP